MSKRIDYIIDDIREQYLENDNNIPWIIGFSGGKDSTVVLTLVWKALLSIREEFGDAALARQVYVVNNDTLVENPIITDYIVEVLDCIRTAASEQKLPITVQTTVPKLEDSFWISFLGKGYPVPNNTFRWCTDRLKIKPTTQFILDKVDTMGEAIVLIGTRLTESATRAKSIRRHEIKGKRLTKHPLNPNTYTYSPIKDLYLEESTGESSNLYVILRSNYKLNTNADEINDNIGVYKWKFTPEDSNKTLKVTFTDEFNIFAYFYNLSSVIITILVIFVLIVVSIIIFNFIKRKNFNVNKI